MWKGGFSAFFPIFSLLLSGKTEDDLVTAALAQTRANQAGSSSLYSEITGKQPVFFSFRKEARNVTKNRKHAELVRAFVSVFRCPVCNSAMNVVDWKSLLCANNHTFDFAKQGYLNMMTRPTNSPYKKELFAARHRTIVESSFFTPMHEWIAKAIQERMDVSSHPFLVLDAGCGEGSHLQKIMEEWKSPTVTGVGVDLSKEGILMAAKRYANSIWIVGDLARPPFQGQSFHVILNILSPSHYREFKRLLIHDGLVVKVVPRPHYLIELREALFANSRKKVYENAKTVSLFKEHVQLLEAFALRYTKKLGRSELHDLVQMTPLAWFTDNERIEKFINQESAEITVDVDILVGIQ